MGSEQNHPEEDFRRQLYRDHHRRIYAYAYRLTGSRQLAEDVTHDSYVAFFERPDRYSAARGSPRSYLMGIARNLAFKQLRRRERETGMRVDELAPARQQICSDPLLAARVRRAVLSLPPLQREAVVLFDYERLKLREIAELTGTSEGAVKARLFRARNALRQKLGLSRRELEQSRRISR